MNNYRTWEKEFFGRKLVVEHGKMAKQAHGACFIKFGDSAILATVDGNEESNEGADFLP